MLRLVVAFSVTSWGRTWKRNRGVGGRGDTEHVGWRAVDVVPDDPSLRPLAEEWCGRLGLVLVDEGDHWHLQPAG